MKACLLEMYGLIEFARCPVGRARYVAADDDVPLFETTKDMSYAQD
jgi:hypothetical protein